MNSGTICIEHGIKEDSSLGNLLDLKVAGGILQQSWQSQILELEARMAASEAKWKLVVGHHPIRNQHAPQNTPELMTHLEPVLTAQVSSGC